MNMEQSPHVMLTICVGWCVTSAGRLGVTVWHQLNSDLMSEWLAHFGAASAWVWNRQRSFHLALAPGYQERGPALATEREPVSQPVQRDSSLFQLCAWNIQGKPLELATSVLHDFVVDLHVVALQEVGGVREEDQSHGIIVS